MLRALELAGRGPAHGPNPRVGCVLLDRRGTALGEGWHAGAGSPHAEVAALEAARRAGADVRGATAVVTLEPCNHTGRTGPCTEALLAAGVTTVVHAVDDPDPDAAGGADRLREAGVDVVGGLRRGEGEELLRVWLHAVRSGRPWVTLKLAATLDGRVAAADGTSRWITSAASRRHAHAHRALVDAIAVGTGTALADDPALTVRPEEGEPPAHQPLRVVVGRRDVPEGARLREPGGALVQARSHDVGEVLAVLAERRVRHLLVEGGPTLAAAFLRAGAVDELHAYVAPVLLGAGPTAVADLGIASIGGASRWRTVETVRLDDDVLVVARPSGPRAGTTTSSTTSSPSTEET
ncbi:bifunctional diaminohydroxyphosphoribosylaminopyrimidine deaminase/5-amino-6-(5-phosphoribosylamino)uracil reductase RibD [Actinotalea sp. Marseille-Q4924]|uniref:bifunctional diaminohydroxyphosphoribosylaminopyrimidine deaminase/5-amino-6-(5-phosphoribosylamino)uracil reductase RibD n=1 Tax=Actinotalea sp. Marseille-Q4924 TaxID=2866571 RepID=UPI001CE40972|nr:bifunctional diaminohydroxyphosphoribosylaminopyrimidine deaminase/5-amino-6-(5-phosphoribosylamino)uracil reductase RibD [Actinotalea sp. Marseille-Q4924]